MKDYSKYFVGFSDKATDIIRDLMKEELMKLMEDNNNRKVIEDYLYLTNNLAEMDFRLNPNYILSVVNQIGIDKGYTFAKVKWSNLCWAYLSLPKVSVKEYKYALIKSPL
jgi:hypothetical protein